MKKSEVKRDIANLQRELEERLKKLQGHQKASCRKKHVKEKLKQISATGTDGGTELSQDGISQSKKTQRLKFASPLVVKQDNQEDGAHLLSGRREGTGQTPIERKCETACGAVSLDGEGRIKQLCDKDKNNMQLENLKLIVCPVMSETEKRLSTLNSIVQDNSRQNVSQPPPDVLGGQGAIPQNRSIPESISEHSSTQESGSSMLSEDSQCSIMRRGSRRKRKHKQYAYFIADNQEIQTSKTVGQLLATTAVDVSEPVGDTNGSVNTIKRDTEKGSESTASAVSLETNHYTSSKSGTSDEHLETFHCVSEFVPNCDKSVNEAFNVPSSSRTLKTSVNDSFMSVASQESQGFTTNTAMPKCQIGLSQSPRFELLQPLSLHDSKSTVLDGEDEDMSEILNSQEILFENSQDDELATAMMDVERELHNNEEIEYSESSDVLTEETLSDDVSESQSDLFAPCSQEVESSESSGHDCRAFFPVFPRAASLNYQKDFSLPDDDYGENKLEKLGAKHVTSTSSLCSPSKLCNISMSSPREGEQENLAFAEDNVSKPSCQKDVQSSTAFTESEVQKAADKDILMSNRSQENDIIRLMDCVPIPQSGAPKPVCAMTAGVITVGPSCGKLPFLVICLEGEVQVMIHFKENWILLCQWKLEEGSIARKVHSLLSEDKVAFVVVSESDQLSSASIYACDIKGIKLQTLGSLCQMSANKNEERPSIQCLVLRECEMILSASARDISVLRKFTFNDSYSSIKAHVIFPRVSGELNSLLYVQTMPSLVLATSKDSVYLWNTNEGTLMTNVKLSIDYPILNCIAAFAEEGLLFLSLHSSSAEDRVTMVILNPKSGTSKTVISYRTDDNQKLVSTTVFKNCLCGLYASGDMTIWDLYSGETIGSLDKGHVTCMTALETGLKDLITSTWTAHVGACVHFYRNSS